MGRLAAEMMLAAIAAGEHASRRVILPAELDRAQLHRPRPERRLMDVRYEHVSKIVRAASTR